MEREAEKEIRNAVIDSARRELEDARRAPQPQAVRRPEDVTPLQIRPEVMTELEGMAGWKSYKEEDLYLGKDLTFTPARSVKVSLERMIRSAIENNIAVEFARLGPAVTEAQTAAAEAAFDWTLFNNFNFTNTDDPRTGTSFSGGSFTPGFDQQQVLQDGIGLRRTLVSGGRLTVQQDFSYTDNQTPGQRNRPNPAEQGTFTLQWDQPLLRNAGSDVTQAEIRINRNAERTSVQTLRRDLIRVVTDTEKTYWDLVQAYYDLQILKRLQARGEKARDQLRARAQLDANQAQIADAVSRVEQRKVDVLRAQVQIRLTSDKLKALVNDPSFPVGSEIILSPADFAVDQPIQFSLLESLRQAIQNRPEVQQAIIAIDDASIRQVVARNQRLPDLSMRLQTRWTSLDNNMAEAVGSQFNGNFVDYLVGLSFEMPIGNRKAEADYRRRRLERMQSVLAYRNAVQQAVVDVKSALDRTITSYLQISQTQLARISAAETLRVLEVRETLRHRHHRRTPRLGTPTARIPRPLRARGSRGPRPAQLAARRPLQRSMGTTLERNRVNLVVPSSADVPWSAPDR